MHILDGWLLILSISIALDICAGNENKKRELINNDAGRRSAANGADHSSEVLSAIEQEQELELLAQSVVKEAFKRVGTLKNKTDRKEMMKLVTRFRDIIMALIESHFEEPLRADVQPLDTKEVKQEENSLKDSDEISDETYNKIIDDVIDQVALIEKNKSTKQQHPVVAMKKNLNAFEASRQNNGRYRKSNFGKPANDNAEKELVTELKHVKHVKHDLQKKHNMAPVPQNQNKQKSWVKYLVYDDDGGGAHKIASVETTTTTTPPPFEDSSKEGENKDDGGGREEQELLKLKTSPEKGMLESTKIKGGQVDFTNGEHSRVPPQPLKQTSNFKPNEDDKKEQDDGTKDDVYELINQMISLLKQADQRNM
ncbi:Uncharacterised protein g2806 [Pycnogonum litorale]